MDFKLMQAYSSDIYLGQVNTLPSCVEICHNPTISEMLLHPELMITKRGMYDEGNDISEVDSDWDSDLQTQLYDIQDLRVRKSANEPPKGTQEPPNNGDDGGTTEEPINGGD